MPQLCKDARATLAPETKTGSTTATGVITPVRATDHFTSTSFVCALSPCNL